MDIFGKTPVISLLNRPFALFCLATVLLGYSLDQPACGQDRAGNATRAMEEARGAASGSGYSGSEDQQASDFEQQMMMEQEARGRAGDGSGGYSQRGAGRPAGPRDVYLTPVKSIISGIDLMPLLSAEMGSQIRTGPQLEGEAKDIFNAGYQALANELMYAHMVAEYDNAQGSILQAQYSPMFKRPTWAVRCGLSLAVRGSDGIDDYQPISESAKRTSNNNNGPGGTDGRGGFTGPTEDDFQSMDQGDMRGGGFDGRDPRSSTAATPAAAVAPPSMISESAHEELQTHIGLVATVLAEQFDSRWKSKNFGSLFSTVSAPVPEPKDRRRRSSRSKEPAGSMPMLTGSVSEMLAEATKPIPMWRPGLIYLGTGPSDDKLDQARESGLDLLFHFDVSIKANGTGRRAVVENVSRLRLYNVHTKKSLVASKGIDNQEAQQMLNAGRVDSTREYVMDQMAGIWRLVDGDAKAVKLPKLTPAVAKRRVASLMAGTTAAPLQKMAEIRLYEALGLITPEEVEGAFYILGGYEGLVLVHGPVDERRNVARQFALAAATENE